MCLCWFVGMLVYGYVVSVVHRYGVVDVVLLVCCNVAMLSCRTVGMVVCTCDVMVLRCDVACGSVGMLSHGYDVRGVCVFGALALLCCGDVVRHCDLVMLLSCCDAVLVGCYGALRLWYDVMMSCGYVVVV